MKAIVYCCVASLLRLLSMVLPLSLFQVAQAGTVPNVVTDFPAIHSLVAMVMGDLDEPELLFQGSTSPHNFTLRPSSALQLESADLVIWVQAELSPWLPESMQALAPDVQSLELMQAPVSRKLPARQHIHFELQHDSDPVAADEAAAHTEDAHAHEMELVDPHGWLDPVNAHAWLGLIADALQQLDPEHASEYQGNARAAKALLTLQQDQLRDQLAPIAKRRFMVAHDSFQYFEQRFGLLNLAAITAGDAVAPGPKRMQTLRDLAVEHNPVCIFSEPGANPRRLAVLLDGLDARTGTLDPVGVTLQPGPDLYLELLQQLADNFTACLQP